MINLPADYEERVYAGVLGKIIGVGSVIPMRVDQVSWSSPRTNRLLLDAGYGATYYGAGNPERRDNATRDLIRVVEQCASGCAAPFRTSGPGAPSRHIPVR